MTKTQLPTIDYKDTETLKKHMDDHGRIIPKRRSQISAKRQRAIARAIKRARFMGLLPYLSP